MPGIKPDRLLSLGDFVPAIRSQSNSTGIAVAGVQQMLTVPVGPPLLVNGATYKGVIYVAPVDGAFIKALWLSCIVKATVGADTLAIDNYDKSASAARNALSTTNIDFNAVPAAAVTGDKLTLTATLANRFMDAGDALNYTMVCGTMTAAGQGYALSIVVIVPEVV